MEVCFDEQNYQKDIEIFLDQANRLTNQKVMILSKHDKELLGKKIQLKQMEEKTTGLEKELRLSKIQIKTYKQQIIPNFYEWAQEIQQNIKNFKNRIFYLVRDIDVEESLDEKEVLQWLKKLDINHKQTSLFDNSSDKILNEFSYPVNFPLIDINEINTLLNALERMIKQKSDQNKKLLEKQSKYQSQIKKLEQNTSQIIQNLSAQLKFNKELITYNEKQINILRNQNVSLQKIVNQTQKSKARLFQQISSNANKVCKRTGLHLQTMPVAKLIKLVGSLSTKIQILKQSKYKLQLQLQQIINIHAVQIQSMIQTVHKLTEQKQRHIKLNRNKSQTLE